MARSSAKDRQYLELHRGKYRVTMAVPKRLQERLGTRLKHPLNTDSLTIANQLKWSIINEMRAMIAQAEGVGDDLQAVAKEFRRQREKASDDDALEQIEAAISETVDALLGRQVGVEVDPYTGEQSPAHAPERVQQATEFSKIVAGQATPLDELHKVYMAGLTVKPRTQSDDRRAIALLNRWCKEKGVEPYLQSFPTKRAAVAFMDDLQTLQPELEPVSP